MRYPRSDATRGARPAADDRTAAPAIELTIANPQNLFHSLDPSPLIGRDLDERVERYIVESAEEMASPRYRMVLHIAGPLPTGNDADALAHAIRAYFAGRREETKRKLRGLMREGRHALAVGLGFLFGCGLLGALALETLPPPFGKFLDEGFLIIGWVANWRPVEIFLYRWRPLRRQRDTVAALAEMEISFRRA